MTGVTLVLDDLQSGVLHGWAMHKKRPEDRIVISVKLNGRQFGVTTANVFRKDLLDAGVGDGKYGWTLALPDNIAGSKINVEVCSNTESAIRIQREFTVPPTAIRFSVDGISTTMINGWVWQQTLSNQAIRVYLEADGRIISTCLANCFREDLKAAGIGLGEHGFRLFLPISASFSGLSDAVLGYFHPDGTKSQLTKIDIPRGAVRALIISDTADQTDASYYYRASLLQKQLWMSGCEVDVIDKGTVTSQDIQKANFIILQRTNAENSLLNECTAAKDKGTLLFYETDDLNIFPSLMEEFGSVRSGLYQLDSEQLVRSVRSRYAAANISDAVIVPNRFMKKWFRSYGYTALLSESTLKSEHIRRRKSNAPGKRWKLLFMSGSPTHEHDFAQIASDVRLFLDTHTDVDLTILGTLSRNNFIGWKNVTFLDRVTYEQMLEVIDNHDAVLVPLAKSKFNFAKSPVKFMEAGARGVPLLINYIPEYRYHINKAGVGYLIPWRSSWIEYLEKAYRNRFEDYQKSAELCQYVYDNFAVNEKGNEALNKIISVSDSFCMKNFGRIRN